MAKLLYNLELTDEELLGLWLRFSLLSDGNKLCDEHDEAVLAMLSALIEGVEVG